MMADKHDACPVHEEAYRICGCAVPDERQMLACATCGSDSELWAWYPDDTRQTIEGHVGPDGTASYDYTGIIDSGEAGEDNGFLCGNCSTLADTIEELCGLPPNVPALEARLQAALGEVAVLERKLREAKGEA